MSREVRKVPQGWQHPKDDDGKFVPLLDGAFSEDDAKWNEGWAMWQRGLRRKWGTGEWLEIDPKDRNGTFTEWSGERPNPDNYMPQWPPEVATHFMMYETTSEGTPISPSFATPEELARWLADTRASAFADIPATYEQWLKVCKGAYAPSAIIENGVFKSGVEAA